MRLCAFAAYHFRAFAHSVLIRVLMRLGRPPRLRCLHDATAAKVEEAARPWADLTGR